jgi:protein-disulfide isomerase
MANDSRRPEGIDRSRRVLEIVTLALVSAVCLAMLAVTGRALLLPTTETPPETRTVGSRPVPPPPPAPLPSEPIAIAGAAIKGDPRAPVAILGYSDYHCPFCVRFATGTLSELDQLYLSTGKALFAFKHLPIASIHPQAPTAAEGSECARRQGQFWAMHDRLFAGPKLADAPTLQAHAKALTLDVAAFDACMLGQAKERVQADLAEAKALGVTGTPTFFIGVVQPDGRVKVAERIVGAQPLAAFAGTIDRLIGEIPGSEGQ